MKFLLIIEIAMGGKGSGELFALNLSEESHENSYESL
jgi:hypothetical protein